MYLGLVSQLSAEVAALETLFVHLARHSWISVLAEPRFSEKVRHAERASRDIDTAYRLADFLSRTVQRRSGPVFWSPVLCPSRSEFSDAGILQPAIEKNSDRIKLEIHKRASRLLDQLSAIAALRPWHSLISNCLSESRIGDVPSDLQTLDFEEVTRSSSIPVVTKSLTGPRSVRLDSRFMGSYSILATMSPDFSDRLENAVPYFWTLSIREAMACDSCALSGVEYDGMPLAFYLDIAKQVWDEARHAEMFLQLSSDLMPELLSTEGINPRLRIVMNSFIERGVPLPIPIEGNMYEAMWSADLTARLILMQIQTEGAAVGRIRKRLNSPLALAFGNVRVAFELDLRDEISHTMLGRRWLRYLHPASAERKAAIETAGAIRNLVIASALAARSGQSVSAAMQAAYAGKRVEFSNPWAAPDEGSGHWQ